MIELQTHLSITGLGPEAEYNITQEEISTIFTISSSIINVVTNSNNTLYDTELVISSSIICIDNKESVLEYDTNLELSNINLDVHPYTSEDSFHTILHFSKFIDWGFEPFIIWELLKQNTNEQINISHLSNALSKYTTLESFNIHKLDYNIHLSALDRAKLNNMPTTLGALSNVESISDEVLEHDVILVKEAGRINWSLKSASAGGVGGDSLFERVNVGTEEEPIWAVRPKNMGEKFVGIYTESFISARGIDPSKPSGGLDPEALWSILGNAGTEQIAHNHLTTALAPYATQDWVLNQGLLKEEKDPTVPQHVKSITIEQITLWNELANAFILHKEANILKTIQAKVGLWTDEFLSARGLDPSQTSGGMDIAQLWEQLDGNPIDRIVHINRLPSIPYSKITGAPTVPSVPSWALQPNPPTYTVDDIIGLDIEFGNISLRVTALEDMFEIVDGNIHVKNNRGLYSDSFLSARGLDSTAGTGGLDRVELWDQLSTNTDPIFGKTQIHKDHLTEALSPYALASSIPSLTGYATQSWVTANHYNKTELDVKLSSALNYKGTKPSFADLPTTGNKVGDTWNVTSPYGDNYAWSGTGWDKLGGTYDFSVYMLKSDFTTFESVYNIWKSSVDTKLTSLDTNISDSTKRIAILENWRASLGDALDTVLNMFVEVPDGTNKCLMLNDGLYTGLFTNGFLSARGIDPTTGGSGGLDPELLWTELGGTVAEKIIGLSRLPLIPYTKITGAPNIPSWALQLNKPSYNFEEINLKPTTLHGYGITDAVTTTGTNAIGTWPISISGTAEDATKLNGLASSRYMVEHHYVENDGTGGYFKIKLLPTVNYMVSFTVRIFDNYESTDILISGYQNINKYWHNPKAVILGKSDNKPIDIIFGYDGVNGLWIAIPTVEKRAVKVFGINNSYQQADWSNGVQITSITTLTGTIQKTITAYPALTLAGGTLTGGLAFSGSSPIITGNGSYLYLGGSSESSYHVVIDKIRTSFKPNTNETLYLGTSNARWINVYSKNGDFSGNLTVAGTINNPGISSISIRLTQAEQTIINLKENLDKYMGMFGVDADNNVFLSNAYNGFWANGFISARGLDPSTGGGGGMDLDTLWQELGGSITNKVIGIGHIPTIPYSKLSGTPTIPTVYAWAQASTKPSYTWSEISSKPADFTPSAHTHVLADISNMNVMWKVLLTTPPASTMLRWPTWDEVTDKPSVIVEGDSRLTNARPASDVYSWAKANSKPTYTYTEVGAAPTSHAHNYASIVKLGAVYYNAASNIISLPAYPTALPATDVYSWAKASSKPSYNFSEIGNKPSTLAGYGITDAATTGMLGSYLPLSGGVIANGSTLSPLAINSTGVQTYISISNSGAYKGAVGWSSPRGIFIYNSDSAKYLGITDSGIPHFHGNTLWHAGNANRSDTDWAVRSLYMGGTGINAPGNVSFLNRGSAIGINTGEILVSNSYADIDLVPSMGIFSRGDIKTNGKIISQAYGSNSIQIGSLNSGFIHYISSGVPHYFNMTVYVNGDVFAGSSYNRRLAYVDEIAGIESNRAINARQLFTNYIGGYQLNPQTYFNNETGLKVAMTGTTGAWSDTLWINGYSGGDVPNMCALHFSRYNATMWISNQDNRATSYGALYKVFTELNANRSDTNWVASTLYCSNAENSGWYRGFGDVGWYNQTYGGGIWMQNSSYVEIYNNKRFRVNNLISVGDSASYWDDTYGIINSTRPADSNNYCHISMVRSGITAMGFGIGSDNSLMLGQCMGSNKTMSNTPVKIWGNGILMAPTGIYSNGYVSARGVDPGSDIRRKTDIIPLQSTLDYVLNTRYVSFTWKEDGQRSVGVIAQDELVRQYCFLVKKDHNDMYTYSYDAHVGLVGNALKEFYLKWQSKESEQDKEIRILKEKIITLENKLNNYASN